MAKHIALLLAALTCAAAPARAADWPTAPVRVIVPYAPGGAADVMGRVFMDAVSNKLGQPFVIENQAGAGGLTASRAVARAAPDGRTFVISGMASHVLAPLMSAEPGFDPIRDATHVAFFGGAPSALLANPQTGVKTMSEFLDLAKRSGAPLQYVSPGIGTGGHVAAAYLADKAHINLVHVPYKGGGAAIFDVIAGHVPFASMNWSTAREHVAGGRLVALAVTSAQRLPDLKDTPTFKELGYPDLVMTTWYAISGPPGLPADIVQKLNAAVVASLGDERVTRQLALEGAEPQALTPAQTTAFITAQYEQWRPAVEKLRER